MRIEHEQGKEFSPQRTQRTQRKREKDFEILNLKSWIEDLRLRI
jgi:hypothetical protein